MHKQAPPTEGTRIHNQDLGFLLEQSFPYSPLLFFPAIFFLPHIHFRIHISHCLHNTHSNYNFRLLRNKDRSFRQTNFSNIRNFREIRHSRTIGRIYRHNNAHYKYIPPLQNYYIYIYPVITRTVTIVSLWKRTFTYITKHSTIKAREIIIFANTGSSWIAVTVTIWIFYALSIVTVLSTCFFVPRDINEISTKFLPVFCAVTFVFVANATVVAWSYAVDTAANGL